MPFTYNLVAGVLAVLEVIQAIQIWTGTHDIINQFTAVTSSSSSSSSTTNATETGTTGTTAIASINVLRQWLIIGKICFAIGLLGSILAQDPISRSFLSVGFTIALSTYFGTLRPALLAHHHAEPKQQEQQQVVRGGAIRTGGTAATTEYSVTLFMIIIISLLSVGSYYEVQELWTVWNNKNN